MANLRTRVHTWLHGTLVGTDRFGNKYYQGKKLNNDGRIPRWVIYQGIDEPSKVPPEWHGWLHYTFDNVPSERYDWQKEHMPNMTGTDLAYYPPGHLLSGGTRDKATGDYEAWTPDSSNSNSENT